MRTTTPKHTDLRVYENGMNATILEKWRKFKLWLPEQEHGQPRTIVDEGCGTGELLALLAKYSPDTRIYGRDASPYFYQKSLETTRGLPNVSVVHRDIALPFSRRNSLAAKIFSSVLHEIYSSSGYSDKTLRSVLKRSFEEMRPGGRILIRDGIKPTPELVFLWLDNRKRSRRPDLSMLSTRERFIKFVNDFSRIREVPYYETRVRSVESQNLDWLVAIQSQDAYEFLLKKDYVENWDAELRQVFGFWTFSQYHEALTEAGFSIRLLADSRNSWINEHRFMPYARLFHLNEHGKLELMHFSPTHMFAVGEKPEKGTP